MARATAIPQSYKIQAEGTLPDGEMYIEIACIDYSAFLYLPAGMTYEGRTYGITGWNSDRQTAYYKSGGKFAVAR